MEYIYVLVGDNWEWEDTIIFLTKDEAIELSRNNPTSRVEIFKRNPLTNGYVPTYNYYKDGQYINNHENNLKTT